MCRHFIYPQISLCVVFLLFYIFFSHLRTIKFSSRFSNLFYSLVATFFVFVCLTAINKAFRMWEREREFTRFRNKEKNWLNLIFPICSFVFTLIWCSSISISSTLLFPFPLYNVSHTPNKMTFMSMLSEKNYFSTPFKSSRSHTSNIKYDQSIRKKKD